MPRIRGWPSPLPQVAGAVQQGTAPAFVTAYILLFLT